MNTLRVVVANEPSTYRDVIAAALRTQHAHLDVSVVDPAELDGELLRETQLVVCSRLTPAVEESARNWVLLYPDYSPISEVKLAGRRSLVPDMDFDDLLAIVQQLAG